MENKTLSHLNSKVWYRLLKVIFIVAFFIVLAAYNFIIFSSGIRQLDQNRTTIKCNVFGNASFSPASINISIDPSYFSNGQFNYIGFFHGYNDYETMAILKRCGNFTPVVANADSYDEQELQDIIYDNGFTGITNWTPQQVDTINTAFEIYQQRTKDSFEGDNQKAQYLDFSSTMFEVQPVFAYNQFLELFVIGNLLILLVFEAMRRIFYYVILGSLGPAK